MSSNTTDTDQPQQITKAASMDATDLANAILQIPDSSLNTLQAIVRDYYKLIGTRISEY